MKIFEYLKERDSKQVIALLESNTDINLRDEQDNYLIQYAVLYNLTDVVKKLISMGCKLDIIDRENHSICYTPIKYGHHDIIKLLVSYNQHQIGINLHDFQDNHGNIPLHFALFFDNKLAFDTLLPYSNTNLRDNQENNSLHIAIKLNSSTNVFHYVTQLLSVQTSVIHPNTDQLTPIHLACLNNNNTIISRLIDVQKTLHITDDQEKTPLMYLIENQNTEMVKYLLTKDTFVDYQDVFGNSVLHYALSTENPELVHTIIPYVHKYNVSNKQGQTPLHHLLENISNITRYPVQMLLEKTNLNIQDNKGNTVLHLLTGINHWQEYVDVLVKKKLNIHLKNQDQKTPLDLIDHKSDFIAMVTLSYYNFLQNKDHVWFEKWENQCNALKETIPKSKEECLKIIKNNLQTKSMPFDKSKYCINITEPEKVIMTSFTGISLDVLSACLFLKAPTLLTKDFISNRDIEDYYTSLGFIKNTRTEFLNFEIMWIYNQLFFPTHMKTTLNRFQASKHRFLVMPLGIELSHGAHANILIYDKDNNSIERFEPNGSNPPYQFNYYPEVLDTKLQEYFQGITYIPPQNFLPKIGFQSLEEHDTEKRIGDPGGFCVAWCFWYAFQRIQHPDLEPAKLVKKLIYDIRIKNIKFKTLIRSFAEDLTKVRQNILQNIDINDWINNTVTDNDIKNVISSIAKQI
jgi:ankyrin repeat protein